MNRTDICVVINSTPKYYYLLPFMVGMLRRYAPNLKWPIYLVTENPTHTICEELRDTYGITILSIPDSKSGFLESRKAGLEPLLERYTYCLPLQDDFILEMPMLSEEITRLTDFLDAHPKTVSARMMPCPGPKAGSGFGSWLLGWTRLTEEADEYAFVYQATLWSTKALYIWYTTICDTLEASYPKETTDPKRRRNAEITLNIAENFIGRKEFWALTKKEGWEHIAWDRKGPWPNAVYLSPFPYRPTAVVRGQLEPWAVELAKREGFRL
jgi:hypothetical protein